MKGEHESKGKRERETRVGPEKGRRADTFARGREEERLGYGRGEE